jgi:hypothetical protein
MIGHSSMAVADGSSAMNHHSHQDGTMTKNMPECKTPLSVLCVSTSNGHKLYLHGKYPLWTLPLPSIPKGRLDHYVPPSVVASNDLAYWLISSSTTSNCSSQPAYHSLNLYHMPFLKRDRYALQQIAAWHSSTTAHLLTLEQSVSVVADNWKTSLKPLDQKLQPLLRLLQNYGVEVIGNKNTSGLDSSTMMTQPEVWHFADIIKVYITMGVTNHSMSIANAMDQFFTGVQMNDQLLQRMERSLQASMANVEATAIESLLRPAQALGWQVQELAGLIRYFDHFNHLDDEAQDEENINQREDKSSMAQDLVDACEQLWIAIENLMARIVTSRMLVRDFCAWLRHAGSQLKAKGTAANSVQRENARKRRVNQVVLERLVSVLNNKDPNMTSFKANSRQQHVGLTESLLNLGVMVRQSRVVLFFV